MTYPLSLFSDGSTTSLSASAGEPMVYTHTAGTNRINCLYHLFYVHAELTSIGKFRTKVQVLRVTIASN